MAVACKQAAERRRFGRKWRRRRPATSEEAGPADGAALRAALSLLSAPPLFVHPEQREQREEAEEGPTYKEYSSLFDGAREQLAADDGNAGAERVPDARAERHPEGLPSSSLLTRAHTEARES